MKFISETQINETRMKFISETEINEKRLMQTLNLCHKLDKTSNNLTNFTGFKVHEPV